MRRINGLIDFGESFTAKNGSFSCGTTLEQKANAVKINEGSDETVYFVDVHTRYSPEFVSNGGLYLPHNLIAKDIKYAAELGVKPDQNASPELVSELSAIREGKKSGLIVPRHVFFQDYRGERDFKPSFNMGDVEETFGIRRLNPQEYLDGSLEYVVNAKHMFNGAALQATRWLGEHFDVPNDEMNIISLLRQKYGLGEALQFDLTGVVMGICVYQTAAGIRQMLPKATINVIADATTHLIYEPLGFKNESGANTAAKAMCAQIGVNYITTKEFLGK